MIRTDQQLLPSAGTAGTATTSSYHLQQQQQAVQLRERDRERKDRGERTMNVTERRVLTTTEQQQQQLQQQGAAGGGDGHQTGEQSQEQKGQKEGDVVVVGSPSKQPKTMINQSATKREGTPAELASGCVFTKSPNYPGTTQHQKERKQREREKDNKKT